jgi:hypothetical protein
MPARHGVFRRAWPIALLVVSAALSPHSLHAKDSDAPVYDINADPATQIAAYVDVTGHKRAADIKRIAIVSFTVEFIDSRATIATPAQKHDDKRADRKAPSAIASIMITPDLAQLRPIADTLYDLATEDLRGTGAEVLTPDELIALPGYAALKATLAATPYRLEGNDEQGHRTSAVVSAHGLPAYHTAGPAPPVTSETEFAKRGHVALLGAHLVVDFLTLHDTGGRLFHSKLVPQYVETVRVTETCYRLVASDGSVASAQLKMAVRAPESPVGPSPPGGSVDEDDSDGAQADTHIERLAINPAVYYDQALRYLGAAQDMLLGALVPQLSTWDSSRQAPSKGK